MSEELVLGLKCRLCGKLYPKEPLNFCTEDFGPLEVVYDYDAVGTSFTCLPSTSFVRRAMSTRSCVSGPATSA